MVVKRSISCLIIIILLFDFTIAFSQQEVIPGQPQIMTIPIQSLPPQQQAEIQKKLSPQQQKAAQEVIQQKGGLTPEAVEILKTMPEFQGLTPDDIMKGKEAIEKKEAIKKDEPQLPKEKIVISKDEEKSIFGRYRTIAKYQEISTNLMPFGYEFFRDAAVKVITDRKDIPAPASYVVGPGDEVKILLWGRINADHKLAVDRDGNITVPNIGPIHVAGLTFEQMATHLIKQSEQIVGANINVTMGALKTIPIFVLCDIKRPGAYTIGSFATITDALLLAGGPSNIGSMRNIQLKRKDKVITTLDLYDLLLKGDKSKDVILQAGDIVFVPVAGPIVGIAGEVKRPAIYEIRDKKDLMTMIDLAGGIIPTAYTQQIQVERIIKNENQIVIDINDKDLSRAKDFSLEDGDLVKIFSIVERDVNAVFLHGNVKRPGKYAFKEGICVKDIIKDSGDLLEETYFDYALIKRLSPPDFKTEIIPINLKAVLIEKDAKNNIKLLPQDNIYIFSKWFFKDKPSVSIEGEVRKLAAIGGNAKDAEKQISGVETESKKLKILLTQNLKIKDAILEAGGLTKDAYLGKGEIIRVDGKRRYETIYFSVEKAMSEDSIENLTLQDEDRVIIHSTLEAVYKKTVSITGEVLKPGKYTYTENIKISDLIFASGNVLESAYLGEAEVTSQNIESGKFVKLAHRKINLKKALEGDHEHNILLKPYDVITVKKLLDWGDERFVTLSGEVAFPGKFKVKKGEKLSEVIERAGGYSSNAYLRGAVFIRERVRELQQKSFEEMVLRLERELLAESSVQVSAALSTEEIQAKKIELESKQKFVESLKKLKATGRMTIKLAHLRLLKGSDYDIELENGDSLYIPTKNNVVNVVGAVMAHSSLVYSDKVAYEDYVGMAGGYSKYADANNTYVLKTDGSARKLGRGFVDWNPFKSRWELSAFGEEIKEIEPGDTIVVPEKLERVAWLREVRDITQILMNTAVTAAVVIKLLYP